MKIRRLKTTLMIGLPALLVAAAVVFVYTHIPASYPPPLPANIVNDASTLNPTRVNRVYTIRSRADVAEAVRVANELDLDISIGGKKHSMGGHAFYPNTVFLDMTSFNDVVSVDTTGRLVVVESGATWEDVQNRLNAHNLAVIAMQGPNIFTVGGSMSVNAHGWDTKFDQVSQTIEWFDLMLSDGEVLRCTRDQNSELFRLVLGGFGLFGVILDVSIRVTDNSVYTRTHVPMSFRNYGIYLKARLNDPALELISANLSVAPSGFLEEMVTAEHSRIRRRPVEVVEPGPERNVVRDKFFINLSRRYTWGKGLRWFLEKQLSWKTVPHVTRNEAMRAPFRRLLYYSEDDVDILQEYFIPFERFEDFTDGLRIAVHKHDANLLNVTVRYISPNDIPFLNYAKKESLAFVLYFNVGKSREKVAADSLLTNDLVDLALELGGTFYLPYLPYYSVEQIRRAYPEIDLFFQKKRQYDSHERFKNYFYRNYGI